MAVLEGDRGHARRVRARLLVQLLGQVLALLLRHLRRPPLGWRSAMRRPCAMPRFLPVCAAVVIQIPFQQCASFAASPLTGCMHAHAAAVRPISQKCMLMSPRHFSCILQ